MVPFYIILFLLYRCKIFSHIFNDVNERFFKVFSPASPLLEEFFIFFVFTVVMLRHSLLRLRHQKADPARSSLDRSLYTGGLHWGKLGGPFVFLLRPSKYHCWPVSPLGSHPISNLGILLCMWVFWVWAVEGRWRFHVQHTDYLNSLALEGSPSLPISVFGGKGEVNKLFGN